MYKIYLRKPFSIYTIWCYLIASLTFMLLSMPYVLTQYNEGVHTVEPTPALNLQQRELTTVLLVSNEASDSYGRFRTVRPEIGLLTSTARTFIQNGITTEYATQVLGTTLNNGQVYAQYIKKSSRFLYESSPLPTVVTSWVGDSTILPQSHNDLYNADRPEWQDQDDRLRKVFVGNTDFVGDLNFNRMKEMKKAESSTSSAILSSHPPPSYYSSSRVSHSSEQKTDVEKLAAQKVLPIVDLPTYTVKNNFSPSRFSWYDNKKANQENTSFVRKSEETNLNARTPKLYYQQIMSSQAGSEIQQKSPNMSAYAQKRKLATTTYFGFADFTTIVGDSVIVFSPSSSSKEIHQGQVTSIQGEATLGDLHTPQVSYVPITVTEDFIVPTSVVENHITDSQSSKTESGIEYYSTSKDIVQSSEHSEAHTKDVSELKTTFSILTSSSSTALHTLSRPSDEEVSAIFAQLQKNAAKSTISIEPSSVPTQGGATTIFFEEDPFDNFVNLTSSQIEDNIALKKENIMDNTGSAEIVSKTIVPDIFNPINMSTSIEKETAATISIHTVVSTIVSTPLEKATTLNPIIMKSGVIIREIDKEDEYSIDCMRTSQVFLTQLPKVVSLLTTYFTVVNSVSTESSASIETNIINTFDIVQTTKNYCIQSTSVSKEDSSLQTERPFEAENSHDSSHSNSSDINVEAPLESTTDAEETDEFTTISYPELDWGSGDGPLDEEDESSEEYDLIYKTLYTTYTYLTTIFQDSSSSILSSTEVITNVVSSTLGSDEHSGMEDLETKIAPTASLESKYTVLNNLNSIVREEEDSLEENDNPDTTAKDESFDFELNTFHTTYTYFTSVFTEGETEVISRTEVLTNVITVKPSKPYENNSTSILEISSTGDIHSDSSSSQNLEYDDIKTTSTVPLNYSTMTRNSSAASITPKLEEYSSVTLVTDVRSSSSNGEGHIINEESKRFHNSSLPDQLIDDQISSESNTDEIVPSATLLLQTSFTTFTYYTTMYNNDNTNVISRLETITNVVTETLNPTIKSAHIEEASLPITYFTTFTYWTKLAKDGIISTLSREETISNIVTPTGVYTETEKTSTLINSQFERSKPPVKEDDTLDTLITASESIILDKTLQTTILEPTTYYTTYTYYTTSYESLNTITNSRFETVTNIVTPTVPLDSYIDVTATKSSDGGFNNFSAIDPKTEYLLYDYKKIIDADGISTLFFETRVSPSINENGTQVEVTSSSSNLYIDEGKKTASATPISFSTNSDGNTIPVRQYKTGLVRLIEGTRIGNHTTTLYQSRVIGTLIDNRYAQIIESTSSFIFENLPSLSKGISPSVTEDNMMKATEGMDPTTLSPSIGVLEGSTDDSIDAYAQSEEDNAKEIDNDKVDQESDKATANLPSKKPIFAPVIRPFASRNRPQFAPKKKTGVVGSATIITRSDFTPTITVTPALKSTNRFSSSRKGGSPQNNFGQSSSRRFSRPGKSTTAPYQTLSTDNGSPNSNFVGGRNRFGVSSRGTANAAASTRRLNSINRSSLPGSLNVRSGFSSGYNSNARFRIKPTAAFAFGQSSTSTELTAISPPESEDSDEDSSTQEQTIEEENETTTENSRRNQNPLLRFRRPLSRPSETIGGITNQRGTGSSNNLISPRRNPLTTRPKVSTSTTTTTTTPKSRLKSFQRPTIAAFSGRQRPQSSLFPPRGLFQAQRQDTVSNPTNKGIEAESNASEATDGDDDTDYEEEDGEDIEDDDTERKRRSNVKTPSKNFEKLREPVSSAAKGRNRFRREADVVYQPRSNFRNRFRRPKSGSSALTEEHKTEVPTTQEIPTLQPEVRGGRINLRFGNKNHSPSSTTAATRHRGIRPTRPNNSRAQFTLREKDLGTTTKSYQRHNTAFRRPTTTVSSRRAPTSLSSNRRLKPYTNNNIGVENSKRNAKAGSKPRGSNNLNTGRGRSSPSRGRNRNEFSTDVHSNAFDGIITVTHFIPSEVTIPIVSGQLTEYKNVITAKTSTEILSPQQYTTFIGANGQSTIALTREESMTNAGGATEITQFILHGSATTTITFTPTTIRGRKTSFSHILPSTIYSVEKLVSTMQPQLANAPLANILLSQLLLGNIGLPGQAPGNPLLGAFTQPTQTQLTPTTEYRTHTSTYVTTIFEGMSTVVPITFQGKKILTTVYDTTAQTIIATEFITDTIISTPTQQPSQSGQVNSLLLQQLLLQHQIQPNFQQEIQSQASLKELLQPESKLQEIDSNNIQDREEDIDKPVVEETQLLKTTTRKKQRKPGKSGHRRSKPQGTSSLESSIITLYVSGRRPGEFSTVLSTVLTNNDSSLQKRQAVNSMVEKTRTVDDGIDFYETESSDFVSEYLLPEPFAGLKILTSSQNENHLMHNFLDSSELSGQTQTLESIVGDVSLWLAKSLTLSPQKDIKNSPTRYDYDASLDYEE